MRVEGAEGKIAGENDCGEAVEDQAYRLISAEKSALSQLKRTGGSGGFYFNVRFP